MVWNLVEPLGRVHMSGAKVFGLYREWMLPPCIGQSNSACAPLQMSCYGSSIALSYSKTVSLLLLAAAVVGSVQAVQAQLLKTSPADPAHIDVCSQESYVRRVSQGFGNW